MSTHYSPDDDIVLLVGNDNRHPAVVATDGRYFLCDLLDAHGDPDRQVKILEEQVDRDPSVAVQALMAALTCWVAEMEVNGQDRRERIEQIKNDIQLWLEGHGENLRQWVDSPEPSTDDMPAPYLPPDDPMRQGAEIFCDMIDARHDRKRIEQIMNSHEHYLFTYALVSAVHCMEADAEMHGYDLDELNGYHRQILRESEDA